MSSDQNILDLYKMAEANVKSHGYDWEIKWQRNRNFSNFTETEFLRESAWVILCSGFKESIVRGMFDYLSLCFCDWESAKEITQNQRLCFLTALSIFKNERKLNAIIKIANIISDTGFACIKKEVIENPIEKLQELPYIGSVTSLHLAKNLGLNVAKNDRHLAAMANSWGYSDAHALCRDISELTGELASVVDVVLWRFAVLKQHKPQSINSMR